MRVVCTSLDSLNFKTFRSFRSTKSCPRPHLLIVSALTIATIAVLTYLCVDRRHSPLTPMLYRGFQRSLDGWQKRPRTPLTLFSMVYFISVYGTCRE